MASRREPADGGRIGPKGYGGRFPDKGTTGARPDGHPDRPRKARPDAAVKTPQQGAERRAGPRYGPVISGDPEMGSLARRTTGCGVSAPAPVGALLPSFFSTGAEDRQGAPAPSSTGLRSVGFSARRAGPAMTNPKGDHK